MMLCLFYFYKLNQYWLKSKCPWIGKISISFSRLNLTNTYNNAFLGTSNSWHNHRLIKTSFNRLTYNRCWLYKYDVICCPLILARERRQTRNLILSFYAWSTKTNVNVTMPYITAASFFIKDRKHMLLAISLKTILYKPI